MRLFDVEIKETYNGSCHYRVSVYPRGYGKHVKFQLVSLDDFPKELADTVSMYLGESNGGSFRPEYAKAIKYGLEYDPHDVSTETGKLEKRLHEVIARNWQLERMCAEYEHTIKKLTEELNAFAGPLKEK
jgi:hypothetical protein